MQGPVTRPGGRDTYVARLRSQLHFLFGVCTLCAVTFAALSIRGSTCGAAYTGFNFAAARDNTINQVAATFLLAFEVAAHVIFITACFLIAFRVLPCIYAQRTHTRQLTQLGNEPTLSTVEFAQLGQCTSSGPRSLGVRQGTTSTLECSTQDSSGMQLEQTQSHSPQEMLMGIVRSGRVHPAAPGAEGDETQERHSVCMAASMAEAAQPSEAAGTDTAEGDTRHSTIAAEQQPSQGADTQAQARNTVGRGNTAVSYVANPLARRQGAAMATAPAPASASPVVTVTTPALPAFLAEVDRPSWERLYRSPEHLPRSASELQGRHEVELQLHIIRTRIFGMLSLAIFKTCNVGSLHAQLMPSC